MKKHYCQVVFFHFWRIIGDEKARLKLRCEPTKNSSISVGEPEAREAGSRASRMSTRPVTEDLSLQIRVRLSHMSWLTVFVVQ